MLLMYYIVYKTTNLINGKYYIGVHKTNVLDDGYLGSGRLLQRALAKHGRENFKREILFEARSSSEMYEKERELVNKSDPNSYNLKEGGNGGFDHVTKEQMKIRNIEISKIRDYTSKEYIDKIKLVHFENYERTCKNLENAKKFRKTDKTFLGKKHSKETLLLMSQRAKARPNTTHVGTVWINNGVINKKIKKRDLYS